ncbi:hypothetical protein KY285_007737 [Solanum tuberosum]|nr:hypothetical protein KY285_007737 [Solanum tuberosum]
MFHDSLSLVVLSLITKLCKWAEVEVLLGDTWVEPKHQIFPIKMHGEGTILKIKKRKVDSGRPGESSTKSVSYVFQHEFDAYLSNQKKQKAQLANLEKAYTGLAKSHCELSVSHSKMKNHDKSRHKFFTWMWTGVKGLWKMLKTNEPLPTLRSNEDGDALATWSNDERAEDNEATKSNED